MPIRKTPFTAALFAICAATAPAAQESGADTSESDQAAAAVPEAVRVANGTQFGDWTINCEAVAVNETVCVLGQTLVRSDDNRFLAEVLAFWSADGSQSFMAARVPNGVFLPSGFAFKAEGAQDRQEFVWQSCSKELCEGLLEVDLETLKALEAGADIYAGYRPALGLEPVVFQLGMDGIGDGMTALRAAVMAR